MSTRKETWVLITAGLSALVVGVLVYLIDRDPTLVPFFSGFSLYGLLSPVFGAQGLSLPTFTHVFALSLLTVAVLGCGRVAALGVCLSWLVIDLAFEAAQHPAIATRLSTAIDVGPAWLSVLEPVQRYASYGTYDALDVLSIFLGACLAYVLIQLVTGSSDEQQTT